MAWVKIDDQFYAHPKLVAAGPLAKSLYIDALCYANQYLTDGFIPKLVARQIAMPLEEYCPDSAAMIAKLVDAGLWSETEAGYQIHDYLEYNPSRESVLKDRAAAKERMQAARGGHRDKNVGNDDVREMFAGSSPEQNAKFARSSPNPVPGPEPDVLANAEHGVGAPQSPPPADPPEKSKKAPREERETKAPAAFELTDEHYEFGARYEFTAKDVEQETEKFLNWARSKGKKYIDWQAGWRNWLIQAKKYRDEANAKIRQFGEHTSRGHPKVAASDSIRAKYGIKRSSEFEDDDEIIDVPPRAVNQ